MAIQLIMSMVLMGTKRRVTHQTAIANVTVPMGGTLPLAGNQIAQAITTDYCGNVVYENEKLSKILTPEGYVTMSGTTPAYHYYVKDHQGNNRVVSNEVGTVEQVNHYYPFGGLFAEGVDTSKQAYKYNGKELDRMHGLDWYDYDARMMDPNLGFMPALDPLCEKSYSISPYAYCANNPVNAVDPDGKLPVFLIPLVKGAIGAVVDAAAQVTVSMANGRGFGEALSGIDYTSVGASFLTSALAMPGMSTTAKAIGTGVITAADAAMDINSSNGFQTVLNSSKSPASAVIDVASSILPGKAVDGVTSAFNKAVTSDLTSASAATMTKATKSGLKQAQSVVNSTSVQTGVNAGGDFVSGLISGQANESMKKAGEGVTNNTILLFPELHIQKNNQYVE